MTRARRWWLATAAVIALVLVAAAVALWSFRGSVLKDQLVSSLSTRLGLDVTLDDLGFSFFPTPGLTGRGLVLRVPERPDLPAFVSIDAFRVDAGLRNLLSGHFHTARLDGLQITIPPGDDKKALAPPDRGGEDESNWSNGVVIDRIETPRAELTILRRKPGDPPLVFEIHELTLTEVGYDRQIPFRTKLTNPVPRGLVDSTGKIGPFPRGRPSDVPVEGDYTFTGADLNTIRGIAGTLASTGRYDGVLSRLNVKGRSETPDFSLDLGGRPLPLTATFETVVDGTNGTTELTRVDARLLNTDIQVTGLIENLPGPGNRDIKLNAKILKGRIEDVLRLVLESDTPLFSGDIVLDAGIVLPPGPARVRERIRIEGRVDLAAGQFTHPQIRAKLAELSRRSQGKDQDNNKDAAQAPVDVFSNVRSGFRLDRGVLAVSALRFEVPGAVVRLDGRFDTRSGALDLKGDLRMQASASRAVGGWKGALVRPFDFLFKRDGAGAVIPIRVSGTRQSPQLDIRFGTLLKRGAR